MKEEGRGLEYGIIAARVCHQLMRCAGHGGRVALRPAVRLGDGLLPDVVYVSERTLGAIADLEPVLTTPPDLVVEVVSAHQAWTEVEAMALAYGELGVPLVWIVDPYAQCVHVYGAGRDNEIFTGPERVPGDSVLPGLDLAAECLFA